MPPDLCRRVRHGDLLIFCFLGGRLRTFLRAFRLRNGRREVSPPRIPAPRQVYKSEAGRLYLVYPGHNDIHTKHDSDNAAKNSGRSQPPSGKGLIEYLLQSAKGAGSRTLFPCKLPTRRKITPRPLPCYNTDTEGRRTYKTFDRKTAAPVFRTTNHRPQSRHLRRRSAVNSVRGRPFEATFRIVLRFFSQSGTILSGELP